MKMSMQMKISSFLLAPQDDQQASVPKRIFYRNSFEKYI